MIWYIHTRANGFKRWVCVDRKSTKAEAVAHIAVLQAYDDPMWATAEYLVTDTLHPMNNEQPTVSIEVNRESSRN